MKKIILFLIALLMITTASTGIEQHAGFPINTGSAIKTSLVAQDIDGDGKLEIIAATENRMVKVFDSSGTLKWENTSGKLQDDEARAPLVSNLSGDGRLEILSYGNPGCSNSLTLDCTTSAATFYMWDASGIKLKEIFVGKYLVSPPAATKEGIILAGVAPVSYGTATQATGIYAFNTEGTKLWYLELGRSVNYKASIQVGDIDGDGMDEAVILTHDINAPYPADGKVWVIKANNTGGTVLWSADLGGDARGAAIADLYNDGKNEVVVTSSSGLYIFDKSGAQINKFNIKSNKAAPAIGDIDGDGVNEVVTASSDDKKINIISKGNLRQFSSIGWITTNAALGDLNGDGKLEIAGGDNYGSMYIWNYNGNLMEQMRTTFDEFTSSIIADLEGDGNKEIILGNSNGNIYAYTYINKPVDTIPPVTTDNVDGQWHNSSVAVTLTAKDNESGAAATYYTIDGTEPTVNSSRGTTFSILNDGIYTIKYFSVDKAGNVEQTKTAINQVKIDKTPPITTDNAGGQWHNSSVAVTLSASDAGSGIMETYYTLDGSIPTASSQKGKTISISGEGNHTIRYYSVDNAGNAEQPDAAIVKIDYTPPQTVDDSDNMWHTADVTLNITASDNISGIESIHYIVDGIEQVSYSPNIQLTFNKEGVNNITYFSVDNAGNVEAMKTAVVRIDRTPPTTMDDSDGKWHNSDITLKLSATDNLSGVNSTYYQVDSANKNFIQSFAGWFYNAIGLAKTDTLQGDSISISEEGIFDIRYYSDDNAGNKEIPVKSVNQVKIDKTPPVTQVTLSGTLGGACYGSDVGVSLNADDGLSGIADTTYTLDGASQLSYAGAFTVSSEGSHLLKYQSTDNAGNNEIQKSASFSIDKTPPEAIIRFDPVSKDIKVYNSETGGEEGYSVQYLKKYIGKEEPGEDKGWEPRRYTLKDCAGNSMVLELKYKKEGKEVRAKVISMQYNGGEIIKAAKNNVDSQWSEEKNGAIRELEENIEAETLFNADMKYSAKKNQTEIHVERDGQKEQKETRAGIAVLELLTDRGGLKVR